LPQLNSRSEP